MTADLERSAGSLSPVELLTSLRSQAPHAASHELLATAGRFRDLTAGAGRLDPLLREPSVSDVCVNGPGPVWVDRGHGLVASDLRFDDPEELRALAVRLVALGGQRLDDAKPFADARLPDGTRVHAVLPPIAPAGVHLSLRVPPRNGMTLADLAAAGSMPSAGAGLLQRVVQRRLAFLVTGGTGTGKTTVLGALLSLVDPSQRLVIVEDAAELRPRHPHVVRLEARAANAEGVGGIGLDLLIRQALRMRPDRLVVGEARGAEIGDLLTALNTGHAGGCGTLHADRPEQVPARVEALAALRGWSRSTAHTQLAAAIDVIIHLCREVGGHRRLASIAVLTEQAGELSAVPAYEFPTSISQPGSHPRLHVVAGAAADEFERLLGGDD